MDTEKTIALVQSLRSESDTSRISEKLAAVTASDLYQIWHVFPIDELVSIFFHLPVSVRADLICMLSREDQEILIGSLPLNNMKEMFALIEPDDLVDIIQSIAPEVRTSVWNSLSDEAKQETLFLLRFDENEAAGIMTPRYLAIRKDQTVQQTIAFVRQMAPTVQNISYIYVLDNLNRLNGVVSLRTLLSADDTVLVSSIMKSELIFVKEDLDQEEVAALFDSYDLLALPVLDAYNRLLGIVTIDDAIDVIREEQTEDVYKMGAMEGSPDQYLKTSILSLVRKRIPWLALLLFAGTITTNMIGLFNTFLQSGAFLFWFIPVIMQTGGNTSVQSSTLMIRGLSRHELGFQNIWQIICRETAVSIIIGIVLGILIILRSMFIMPTVLPLQSLILGGALSLVVIFASVIGVVAPLLIYKFGLDPTVMTGPLMATFIDVSSLAIYFLIAQMILGT